MGHIIGKIVFRSAGIILLINTFLALSMLVKPNFIIGEILKSFIKSRFIS